jgi:ApaG protein
MSDTTTQGIRVQVESLYDEDRSAPQENYYFFAYRVRISNVGTETAQLLSREWIITDATGYQQQVQGPGEAFEYTSFCPLSTPVGSMHGTYKMARENGEAFDAVIAPFSLAVPHSVN